MSEKVSKSTRKEEKEAVRKLWERGVLSWKLKGIQKEMYAHIKDPSIKRPTFLVSRRSGKSFTMCLTASETCLKKPNAIVKYLCPKQKMVRTIVVPIMRIIFADCPEHLKPEYIKGDNLYRFPNGAEIQFAGADNGNAENLRGGASDENYIDEAGFIDDLNYCYFSVLAPTTRTTKGKTIFASTPSKYAEHEFMTDFVQMALDNETLIKYTIYDNPLFTPEIIQEIIDEYPLGIDDPQFRREYMCEVATDAEIVVVPEFDSQLEQDVVVQCERPVYYDGYVGGDPGGTDLTVLLFAFYDFQKQTIVIEDELVLDGKKRPVTTEDIASGVNRKEKMYFTNEYTGTVQEPTLRIMDNNNKILINDLYNDHRLRFIATAKDNKQMQIDKVRRLLKNGQIKINPRCKNLIRHIRSAKWKKNVDGINVKFQHVKGSSDGKYSAHHCDGLDALIYLVRNVRLNKNPYPEDYHDMKGPDVFDTIVKFKKKNEGMVGFMNSIINKKS